MPVKPLYAPWHTVITGRTIGQRNRMYGAPMARNREIAFVNMESTLNQKKDFA
jgi:hypothetical protein